MLPIRDHEPSNIFPFMTIAIIAMNVIVFFFEITSPDLEAFISQWALIPSNVDLLNPLSLIPFISSQFLHAGYMHIISNMWFLWIFGDNVEAHFGHFKYLLFYLVSGILAAIVQFFFLIGSDIPMLGASGAVAGVLGAYLALFPRHRVDTLMPGLFFSATLPASFVLLLWFGTQLLNGSAAFVNTPAATGGVAWWAHIGGFAFGWMMGKMTKGRSAMTAARFG